MPKRSSDRSTIYAWLQLVRLPNVFTAMADVAMGYFFVRGMVGAEEVPRLALLVGASSLLYIAGVVLNDVFDFPRDREERPERPLPSGRIARSVAAGFGWSALLLGVGLAWAAGWRLSTPWPGIVSVGLAACIVLYDVWAAKTPLGPPAMGACRMLNVLLGMSVAAGPWLAEHYLVAGAIGVYITGVTWFARREVGGAGRLQLALAAAVMLAGIAMLAWLPVLSQRVVPLLVQEPQRWRLFLTILGLLIGWRCVKAIFDPSPCNVQMAVIQGVTSLIVLDSAACFAVAGVPAALLILLLLVPTVLFGRWIQMT